MAKWYPNFPPFRGNKQGDPDAVGGSGRRSQGEGFEQNPRDFVWISFTPAKLESTKLLGRFLSGSGSAYSVSPTQGEDVINLLAPKNWGESIHHDWAPYDGVGAGLASDYVRRAQEVGLVFNVTKNLFESNGNLNIFKDRFKDGTNDIISIGDSFYNKLDAASIYKDSQRRVFTLTFLLADGSPNSDDPESAKNNVVTPVKQFMKYSCAKNQINDLFGYTPPYIFEICAIDGHSKKLSDLLFVRTAALTDVQPTWMEPYRNGYPTYCEVQLTFQDLEPLFESTYTNNSSVVNVNINETFGR